MRLLKIVDVYIRKTEKGTCYDIDVRVNGSSSQFGCGLPDPALALIEMSHLVAPYVYQEDYRLMDFDGDPLDETEDAQIRIAIGHAMMDIDYPDVLEKRVLH